MANHSDLSPELEAFRPYLVVLTRGQIPAAMRSRMDASDIVQDTLLEAHRKRNDFRGTSPRAFAAWLRALLTFTLIDAMRHHGRQGRDAAREQSLRASLEQSAIRLDQFATDDTSPSVRFDRDQQCLKLAAAIEALPAAQREAIIMRYSQSMPLAEIAAAMEKSVVAVAGLLKRGTAKLREMLAEAP